MRYRDPVAPFVGAWIEILTFFSILSRKAVAPFVGAWIEIFAYTPAFLPALVAPFVGAWIEIRHMRLLPQGSTSLPSWERGLKCKAIVAYDKKHPVAPFVGAWIEIIAKDVFKS